MTRLHHIQVVVPLGATDKVVPFYEALGLKRIPKPVAEGIQQVGAWFEVAAGGQVHVSERDGAADPGGRHFGLVVEDYDSLLTELETAGHQVDRRPAVQGTNRAMVSDPEGNVVEVIESAGGFA